MFFIEAWKPAHRLVHCLFVILSIQAATIITAFPAAAQPVLHEIEGADADRLAQLGAMQRQKGDIQSRLDAALEEVEIRKRHQPVDWWQVQDAVRRVAMLRHALTLSPEAIAEWEEARAAYEVASVEARPEERLAKSRAYLAVVSEHFGEDLELYADTLEGVGVAASNLGKSKEGERALSRCLDWRLAHLEPGHPRTGGTLSCRGYARANLGRAKEAVADCRRGIDIMSAALGEYDEKLLEARLVLGMVLDINGDTDGAEAVYRSVLEPFRQGKVRSRLRMTVLRRLALLLEARRAVKEAADVRREIITASADWFGEDHRLTLVAKTNLATTTPKQGGDELMGEVVESSIRVFGPDHRETYESIARYAALLHIAGRFRDAEVQYRKIIAAPIDRYRLEEHYEILHARNMMGLALHEQGRVAEAGDAIRDDIEEMSRAFGPDHPHTREALKNLLPVLMAASEFEDTERICRRLLPEADNGMGFRSVYLLTYLGVALHGQGDLEGAEAELRKQAELAEATFASDSGVHRSLNYNKWSGLHLSVVLATRGKSRDVFAAYEASLARGFLDELAGEDREDGIRGARPRSLEEIQAAIPEDAALIAWIDWRWKRTELEEHWALVVRREGEPIVVRIQKGARDSWTDEDRDLATLVRDRIGQPPHLQLAMQRGTQLRKAEAKKASLFDEHAETIAALRRQRWDPLRDHLGPTDRLPAVQHLIVVPVGDMAGVPVEALAPGYTVTYTPSGSSLSVLAERAAGARTMEASSPRLLALAADGRDDEHGRGLVGVRREVDAVAALFRDTGVDGDGDGDGVPAGDGADAGSAVDRATLLVGGDAGRADFLALARDGKLANYTHLHVACHAAIDTERPLESYLQLSASGGGDGRLTMRDLMNLDVRIPRNVALSACRTGGGKYLGVEGVFGFGRALVIAGVDNLIVTRWEVDDIATSLLMTRYYANCFLRGQSSSRALAGAREWLRNLSAEQVERLAANPEQIATEDASGSDDAMPYSHPYYWAGFMAFGAPPTK